MLSGMAGLVPIVAVSDLVHTVVDSAIEFMSWVVACHLHLTGCLGALIETLLQGRL